MTTLKTQINGEPFELTVDDGLVMEFEAGKLTVTRKPVLLPSVLGYGALGSSQPTLQNNAVRPLAIWGQQ